jgi:L-lactate permease
MTTDITVCPRDRTVTGSSGPGGVLAKMVSPQNLAIGTASVDRVG